MMARCHGCPQEVPVRLTGQFGTQPLIKAHPTSDGRVCIASESPPRRQVAA